MNLKKYAFILLTLLYMDIIYSLFTYDMYLRSSIINILLFGLVNAAIIHLLTSFFNEKLNKIILYVVYSILLIWYSTYFIFYKIFITPFSITLFGQSDQVLKFGNSVFISIISNIYIIILFALPIVLTILFRKKLRFESFYIKNFLINLGILIVAIGAYIGNIYIQGKGIGTPYNLFYETKNIALNIERLGIIPSTYLDIKRSIFGFNEKIQLVKEEVKEDSNELFDYDYNNLDLDFSGGSGTIYNINNFMSNETGTKQNKYTGMFKDKNLVFIVAESFSEIAVREDLTPTLYKLVHDGFYFKNFYTSNNLSTIGGEFQALTGLYADNEILGPWRSGNRYFPYGLANVFKGLGYNTYAYHNNSAYFQDRNVYIKSQGFDNFKGCYTGLEKLMNCNAWPQSDVEMVNVTIGDYINSDKPFVTYYMTVSGHFYYTFNLNSMAAKNRYLVDGLNYPEEVKGYLATQIELDRALESLMNQLKDAGKLDDTVIVLLADHYPYYLSNSHINYLSDYYRDTLIESNSNNLIIYNSKMKPVEIDKVGMSIDVLPTVLNLFGVNYDSRLIMGKDILSNTEGIAIFKDKSWVTNKGTYYASTGVFESSTKDIPDGYVNYINNVVNNRVAISRMIVTSNYYNYIMNK